MRHALRTGDDRAELCQNCTSRCGTLARTWVLDRDMGGLTAGTVMAEGTFSLCERRLRAKVGYCVPAQVPPESRCTHLLTCPPWLRLAGEEQPLVCF